MPRVSREQSDRHRIAIEEAAARLFREQGFNGVSVNDLMGAAGLTHGGFYGHFESKDALAALACSKAFEQALARWDKRTAAAPDNQAALAAIIKGYLSTPSRDAPGGACPVATLAADVAREPVSKPVCGAYLEGLAAQLDHLIALQGSGDSKIDRNQALVQLSTLVGATVLARATRQDPVSAEFLRAAREQLLAELQSR